MYFFKPVTGNKFPVLEKKILIMSDIILLLSPKVLYNVTEVFLWHRYISSCDRKCSSYYKEYCVRQMKNIFSYRDDFYFYFITRNILSVTQGVHPVKDFLAPSMCTNHIFSVTRTSLLINSGLLSKPNVTQLNSTKSNSKATSIWVRHSSHLEPT